MTRKTTEWLDHLVDSWAEKGWITADAHEKIRKSYGRDAKKYMSWPALPLYALLAAVGLAIVCVGVIWGAFLFWYHVPASVRIGAAVVLLLLSQAGVGVTMFRNRQGTFLAEGVALFHVLAVFASLAMAEQTFYVGWDLPAYVMVCAVLFLPAAYFLHSLVALLLYDAALLYWSAAGGTETVFGGMLVLWILLALTVPLYQVFVRNQEKWHLSVFSWAITITVFAAFSLASYASGQIPFLVLGSLAVTLMLAGYSIDRGQSWGLPFRWFGRLAAAGALLFSCLPSAWQVLAEEGLSGGSVVVTLVLFAAMLFMLCKTVHYRRGSIVYFAIPCILAVETILVRAGLYSSLPLLLSSAYTIFVGFYEISQGFQKNKSLHLKFGLLLFAALLLTFFFGTDFSPLFPLLVMIVLGLAAFQLKRTESDKEEAALRASRRIRLRHQGTQVREEEKTASSVQYVRDSADDEAMRKEWMQDLHLPSPEEIKGTEDLPQAVEKPAAKPAFTAEPPPAEKMPEFTFSLQTEEAEKAVPQQMQIPPEHKGTPAARLQTDTAASADRPGDSIPEWMHFVEPQAAEVARRENPKARPATGAPLGRPYEQTITVNQEQRKDTPTTRKGVHLDARPQPEHKGAPTARPQDESSNRRGVHLGARPQTEHNGAPTARPQGSPWSQMQPAPKRKKYFTQSPWSHKGGDKA